MDELTDLILTMIVANTEHDGDLNFNKIDIDKIISQYNILNSNNKQIWNERGWIVLWKNKYITDKEFCEYMDIELEDNSIWIVCDDFGSILNGRKYSTEIKVLDNDDDWWNDTSYYKNDIEDYWNKYDEKTLKEIIDFCIKNEIEIEVDNNKELITKENTIVKDGDIYFKDEKLVEFIDDYELEPLRDCLNDAICEAQDDADRSECYEKIRNSFENKIGEFKIKSKIVKNYKGEERNAEKLYIKFSDDFSKVEEFLKDTYGNYEFLQEDFGSLVHILKEMDYFEFDSIDFNHIYGSIEKSILNEFTRNKLDWY